MNPLAATCTDIGGWHAALMFLGVLAFFAFCLWRVTR